jgi:hypothetical protein
MKTIRRPTCCAKLNVFAQLLPPIAYPDNSSTSLCTKFVHTSTNKIRCPVNVVTVSKSLLRNDCAPTNKPEPSGHLKVDVYLQDQRVESSRFGTGSRSTLRRSCKHMILQSVQSHSHTPERTLRRQTKAGLSSTFSPT